MFGICTEHEGQGEEPQDGGRMDRSLGQRTCRVDIVGQKRRINKRQREEIRFMEHREEKINESRVERERVQCSLSSPVKVSVCVHACVKDRAGLTLSELSYSAWTAALIPCSIERETESKTKTDRERETDECSINSPPG